jgi:uncharacterized membrane protein YkoI
MIVTKLVATALALGIVGGGVAGTHAAQPAHAIQPTSTVSQEEKAEKQDPNEQAKLQKEATITQDQATKTVLEQYQGGTINQVELEDEDGSVVYGFDVVSKDSKSYDVKVDAKTGKVLKADNDNENENDQEENEKVEKQDPNEQAKLQKEATITQDQATKTVLDQYQGGTVNQVELEDEDGSVVYGFDVVSKDGKSYDVKVDAKTGEITKADNDNEAVDNDKEVNDDNQAQNN